MNRGKYKNFYAAVVLSLGLTTVVAPGAFAAVGDSTCDLSDGAGTAASPFLIDTAEELAEINDCFTNYSSYDEDYRFYELTADIDLTPNGESWNTIANGWKPIGYQYHAFYGHFDGNNHTISNLFIYNNEGYSGLFGNARHATIKNLNLVSDTSKVSVSSPLNSRYKYYYGAAIGYASMSNASNITSNLNVTTSNSYTGGVFGSFTNGNARDVSSSGTVTISADSFAFASGIGGIAGELSYAHLMNAEFTGQVGVFDLATNDESISVDNVGGIVGNSYEGTLTNSKNSGEVRGVGNVGGVVGFAERSTVSNVENTGLVAFGIDDQTVPSTGSAFGGLVGQMYSSSDLKNSTSRGNIVMNDSADPSDKHLYVGGAVGFIDANAVLEDIHVVSTINSGKSTYVAGLVGYTSNNAGLISNSSFAGEINNSFDGEAYIGGAVGYADNQLHIRHVAINTNISAPSASYVGGFFGYTSVGDTTLTIEDSFVRGTLTAFDYAGGFVGSTQDRQHTTIENVYTTVIPVVTKETDTHVDPFALGAWKHKGSNNFFLASELGQSSTGIVGSTEEALRNRSTFVDAGWNFSEGTVRWVMLGNANSGLPYLDFNAQTSGSTPVTSSRLSPKMFISVGAQTETGRRYVINVATKFAKKNAVLFVTRNGRIAKVLFKGPLNALGNRVLRDVFTLREGDVVKLKVANRKMDQVTI